ncbi:hypothetical protein BJX70DRAFT_394307 [Aspergillus crustosus]
MENLFNPKTLLFALAAIGAWGTHGRSAADGSTALISEALANPNYLLPGTQSGLLKTFTGFQTPFDLILRLLTLFWWEAADGSHPAASAVSLYFLGQLLPGVVIVYLNALRGDKPSIVMPTLWLLLFQVGAIGATGFIWALAYTIKSPTVLYDIGLEGLLRGSIITSLDSVWALTPALILGFLFPSFVMALPVSSLPFVTTTFKQYAIAIWNVFPLLVLGVLYIIRPVITKFLLPRTTGKHKTRLAPGARAAHLRAVRITTIVTLIISSTAHILTTTLSLTTLIFPSIFNPQYVNDLSPSSLFLPPISPAPKALTPGDGTRGFLLWDQVVGYSTIMIVVGSELLNAIDAIPAIRRGLRSHPDHQLAGKIQAFTSSRWAIGVVGLGLTLLVGPGSTILIASWARDEILFGLGDW